MCVCLFVKKTVAIYFLRNFLYNPLITMQFCPTATLASTRDFYEVTQLNTLINFHLAYKSESSNLMGHRPIRQTSELGKFITTAAKSVTNLVELRRLVAKYRKMWKIQSCQICEFCITLIRTAK
jgi:hypothetical protein